MRKRIALVLVFGAIGVLGAAVAALAVSESGTATGPEASQGAARSIRIAKATDDHGFIRLTVKIVGWKPMWRIYVNGRYNNFSTKATKGSTKKLSPGTYRVYAVLAANKILDLKPRVKSNTVTVTVDEPTGTTETTEQP